MTAPLPEEINFATGIKKTSTRHRVYKEEPFYERGIVGPPPKAHEYVT